MTLTYRRPTLTQEEAHQAAARWLESVGSPPTTRAEPVSGVIELQSPQLLVRVRWGRSPISQVAVLGLLRAADGAPAAIFSVSGFSPGAVELADGQAVALFTFDPDGGACAVNAVAEALQPVRPPDPLAAVDGEDPSAAGVTAATGLDPDDWVMCASCGTDHHRTMPACPACGATPKTASPITLAPPPPPREPVTTVLECASCGSHEIRVLTAPSGARREAG